MRIRAVALGGVVMSLATACSLLIDTSGLSSNADAPDGAMTASEAGGDALATPDGPVGRACSVSHFFCADFDQGNFDFGWSGSPTGTGGYTMMHDSLHVSSPRSLVVRSATTSNVAEARLAKTFPPRPQRASLSFQIFTCTLVQNHAFEAAKLEENGGVAGGVTFFLERGRTSVGTEISTNGSPIGGDYSLNAPIAENRWVHIAMTVDFSPTNGAIKVVVDRNEALPALDLRGIPTSGIFDITRMRLGLWAEDTPAACDVRFDDVVLDLEP